LWCWNQINSISIWILNCIVWKFGLIRIGQQLWCYWIQR
jgi:hypothetical protein